MFYGIAEIEIIKADGFKILQIRSVYLRSDVDIFEGDIVGHAA